MNMMIICKLYKFVYNVMYNAYMKTCQTSRLHGRFRHIIAGCALKETTLRVTKTE